MILTLNPGGDEINFKKEDSPRFAKGNFSVQSYHSYLKPRNPKNKMAKAIREFFVSPIAILKNCFFLNLINALY